MSLPPTLPCAPFVAASAASSLGALLGNQRVHAAAKYAIAPSLALDVASRPGALAPPRRATTARLVAGLVAAGWGDHFMLAESQASGAAARPLLRRGAAAFAGEQIALLAEMRAQGLRVERTPRTMAIAGGLGVIGVLDAVAARRDGADLTPHLVPTVYGLLLTTMAATAQSDRRTATGGALFLASDAVIIARQLVPHGRARRVAEAVIMASYTAASYLLVDGLASERV